MDYKEQIQHPNWQKKRLEIMMRDNWKCRRCGKTNIALHVHHLYYIKGLLIWEYDNEGLVTLCKSCHKAIHEDLAKLSGIIAFRIFTGEIDVSEFNNSKIKNK